MKKLRCRRMFVDEYGAACDRRALRFQTRLADRVACRLSILLRMAVPRGLCGLVRPNDV